MRLLHLSRISLIASGALVVLSGCSAGNTIFKLPTNTVTVTFTNAAGTSKVAYFIINTLLKVP
jgi:hypothetical protein